MLQIAEQYIEEDDGSVPLSPFAEIEPGISVQYALDSTSLGYMKTCPRLYQYTMLQGYQSKSESVHLRFGIEYHQALHDYETARASGLSFNEAVHITVKELIERIRDWDPEPQRKSEEYKSKDNLLRSVIWYLDHFKDDAAKTVILSNGRPAMEVSFRFELDIGPTAHQPYLLCGHLDRIVDFNGSYFVMDRKTTTSALTEYYFGQYEPNNQMTLYTIAGQVVLGSPIKGVIIDAVQIQQSASHFARRLTYRTSAQLEEWLRSLDTLLAQYKDYALNDYYPLNDTACDKFGGCRFRAICSRSPEVRDAFLGSDYNQLTESERWNPLKPR